MFLQSILASFVYHVGPHVGTILAPFGLQFAPWGLHLGCILRSGGSPEAFQGPFLLRQRFNIAKIGSKTSPHKPLGLPGGRTGEPSFALGHPLDRSR